MEKRGRLSYLYAFFAVFLWGTVYVVGKYVMAAVPPMVVTVCRYAVAILTLMPVLLRKPHVKIQKQDWPRVCAIAVIGYFLSMNLQFFGTMLTNASVSSLINSMNPVFIMLFAALILKEKLTAAKAVSVLLSLAGVYLVVGGAKGGLRPIGVACALGAMLCWALMSVLMRQLTQKYDALQITRNCLAIGLVLALPFAGWSALAAPPVPWSAALVLGLIFLGVFGTAAGNLCWNRALSQLEAGSCCLFYPVMPLTSVIGGALFLGEPVTGWLAVGAALIASGVVFGTLSEKRRQMRGL